MYTPTEKVSVNLEELATLKKVSDLIGLAYEKATTHELVDITSDAYIALLKFIYCCTATEEEAV